MVVQYAGLKVICNQYHAEDQIYAHSASLETAVSWRY